MGKIKFDMEFECKNMKFKFVVMLPSSNIPLLVPPQYRKQEGHTKLLGGAAVRHRYVVVSRSLIHAARAQRVLLSRIAPAQGRCRVLRQVGHGVVTAYIARASD